MKKFDINDLILLLEKYDTHQLIKELYKNYLQTDDIQVNLLIRIN